MGGSTIFCHPESWEKINLSESNTVIHAHISTDFNSLNPVALDSTALVLSVQQRLPAHMFRSEPKNSKCLKDRALPKTVTQL